MLRAPRLLDYPMQNPLTLVTLTDNSTNSRVPIAPERGAIVTSFKVSDRELLYMDVATLADRSKNVRGGIPVLFPIAGKLQDDAWQRDGLTGTMTQHGFARQLEWKVDRQSHAEVSMSLGSSPETLQRYPWPFHATLTYSLKGACLRSALRVRNTGDTAMPYALGFHPYFRVDDKREARIESTATRAFNNVSKQLERFKGFDFTASEVDLHLLDHGSDQAALQMGDGPKIVVRASDDFGVWVAWTLAGKDFVCLEPWTSPGDALNTGEKLITVAPGASHGSWMEIAYTKN